MTTLTARVPRRLMRKCLKSFLLMLNAHQLKYADYELARIRALRDSMARAEIRQTREKTRLIIKRTRMEGW